MKIQVYGPGCGSCKQLHEHTLKAIKELGKNIEVEYITDISKIVELGVMSSPVLVIDNKVAAAGNVPSVENIKNMIEGKSRDKDESSPKGGCSCGGKC
jgi:small redox-active disulfide protein 2